MLRNIITFLLLGLVMASAARADECLKVALVVEQGLYEVQRQAVLDLYHEAGLCAEPVALPLARAQDLVRRGLIDAELGRASEWLALYGKDVVTVPTPVARLDIMAIWLDGAAPEPKDLSALKGRRIASPKGAAWAQTVARDNGAAALELLQMDQLSELLTYGRVDYVVLEDLRFRKLWPGLKARHASVRYRMLGLIRFYHVLAKHRQNLVAPLDAAVQRLGGEHFFDKYLNGLPEPDAGQNAAPGH